MSVIHYVPLEEFDRVWRLDAPTHRKASVYADMCRINALYMIMRAGSGHIGSSFSSLDIVTWLYLYEFGVYESHTPADLGGVYFSSKGHDAPGLYSVLMASRRLDFELIHQLRRDGGLPGHPDVQTPWIEANTGPLGMGISKAKGMAMAHRRQGHRRPIFVLTGDGELQEGQIWESLQGAANRRLGEITVVVDHNKIQSDTWVSRVSDLGDLEAKFAAFGWEVKRCDGHDFEEIAIALSELSMAPDVPGVIIADTVKGKGVSFMEQFDPEGELYGFHSGAPALSVYVDALGELVDTVDRQLRDLREPALVLAGAPFATRSSPTGQRLVGAYSAALCALAAQDERIIALDGDLVLDTGLVPFARQFPDRFIECGIAEQDMVSQAGGLALAGLLPVVHSFACFLSARPAEQIFNNASEQTKVVYVGSLAGVLPGGPGHSHQAVRDIATLAAVPGLLMVEPCLVEEVAPLLELCLLGRPESVYFRLVTIPVVLPFDLPPDYRPAVGEGVILRQGSDGVIVAAGPVALAQAFGAAELLAEEWEFELRVVNLPWLNRVDPDWLAAVTDGISHLITVENHSVLGGQGQLVLATMASLGRSIRCLQLGVQGLPTCGTAEEVLAAHGLDARSIAEEIARLMAPAEK